MYEEYKIKFDFGMVKSIFHGFVSYCHLPKIFSILFLAMHLEIKKGYISNSRHKKGINQHTNMSSSMRGAPPAVLYLKKVQQNIGCRYEFAGVGIYCFSNTLGMLRLLKVGTQNILCDNKSNSVDKLIYPRMLL